MLTANNEELKNYLPADGLDELKNVMAKLVALAKQDPTLAATEHFIDYRNGEQRALFKLDMRESPVMCWHIDLLGRPATKGVNNVVAGIGQMIDISKENIRATNEKFLSGDDIHVTQVLNRMSADEGHALLSKRSRKTYNLSHPPAQSYSSSSMFKYSEHTTPAANETSTRKPTLPQR